MEYCSHLYDGSAKYQLAALDAMDRRARRLIGEDSLLAKLQSLDHRRKVASLSVFDLVTSSPFFRRTARHRAGFHPYVVNIPKTRTKRFASSFLIRMAGVWNALPSSVFPNSYNLGIFKTRVNRHILDKRVPS
ncbi:jg1706 [Pararge aegeria aegeria]|uniref:Jg1706 protein n=1 Tax=Pararge aegeria aegeria TaxID=348720 RepID=A0A8S4SPB2_9NEOP|nr:jg1706 [Pararge aegeria aegeria]